MFKYILMLLVSGFYHSQTFETTPVMLNGPNNHRITIAILGDGFTATQLPVFTSAAQNSINYLFTKSPYKEYRNYFNAYAVKVISAESGIKHPGTATDVNEPVLPITNPDNYLGSTFDSDDIHRCIYSNNTNKIAQVLAVNVPDYDVAYILGNSTNYGGCGGTYAFVSLAAAANELVVHELGHSFADLADEYWYAPTGESANKTQNSNPNTIKWKNWVGTNMVGIYPFVENTSWHRPHQSCEMRFLNQQFCSVCKEKTVETIHELVSPVDSFTPSNTSAVNITSDVTFTVNEILPIPNTLVNSWILNGSMLSATGNSITINPSQLNDGNNTLLFSVKDNTALVRTDNHSTIHLTNVSWVLNKSALGTAEVRSEERRFSIYPNPTSGLFFLKGQSDFKDTVSFHLIDSSGKQFPVQYKKNNSRTLVIDISNVPSGSYFLRLYENKTLMLSEKISKL